MSNGGEIFEGLAIDTIVSLNSLFAPGVLLQTGSLRRDILTHSITVMKVAVFLILYLATSVMLLVQDFPCVVVYFFRKRISLHRIYNYFVQECITHT